MCVSRFPVMGCAIFAPALRFRRGGCIEEWSDSITHRGLTVEPNPLFQFNLRDIYRVMFRHKWRSGGLLLLTIALVLVAMIFCPRKYISESQVLVNVGAESLTADPITNKSQAVSLQVAREEEITSILDLFRSHAIAVDVVDKLSVAKVLNQGEEPSYWETMLASAQSHVGDFLRSKKVSDHELAVRKIRKWVKVASESKSNVIRVTAKCETPKLAQEVVTAYVEAARQKHGAAHESENSTEFLKARMANVKGRLEIAADKFRDSKNRVGVVSIDGRKRTLEEQVRQMQLDVVKARSELKAYEDRVGTINVAYGDLPTPLLIDSSTSATSKSLDELKAELFKLRVQSQGAATRFRPNHPKLGQIKRQLENAERDLAIEELRFAHSSVNAEKSRIQTLEDQILSKRGELEQLNEDESQLKSMAAEVKLLEDQYAAYHGDLAKAQVLQDRRQQEITNINVFQPASLVETPVSPNRKLLFAIGVVAAVFGAVGVALVSEFLDTSLKTPEDLETQLDLPVLESIPVQRRNRGAIC